MTEIPLTRGLVAYADDSDAELLARYKWHALKQHADMRVATEYRTRCDRVEAMLQRHRRTLHPGTNEVAFIRIDELDTMLRILEGRE